MVLPITVHPPAVTAVLVAVVDTTSLLEAALVQAGKVTTAAAVPVGMVAQEQFPAAAVAAKAQQAQTAYLMLVAQAERVLLVA
jgi:hypothetical protein